MMLEQSLISPNFLGKESFRWFIGICTKYSQTGQGGYKAKVRIIGYHPDSSNVVKDEELPWAHVLVPLNMGSGTGSTGVSYNPRGGEHVIGFFMDGDNAQQPVIIGSLFTGGEIQFPNTWDKGTNNYSSFKPKTKPLSSLTRSSTSGKGNKSSTGITNVKGEIATDEKGKEEQTQGSKQTGNNGQKIHIPPVCQKSDSTYGRILQALRDFIKALNTINQATSIVSTVSNSIANLPSLIQEVGDALSDLFSKYCKKIRDDINKRIYKNLKDFFDRLLPKDIKVFKELVVDKAIDSIWCIFDKIIKGLSEFIITFLTSIVDKVISIPLCAAESFVGSMLSTVTSQISEAIGPALSEINSAIGGVIGPISSYVSQALGYANAALSFLSCETAQCKQQFDYEMNKGWIPPETIEDINNVVNYPSNAIQDAKKSAEEWLGINNPVQGDLPPELQSQLGGCDVTSLQCGLPSVTFFGGGGVGAAGLAVVDSIGRVAGVNMTSLGTGYSGAPYISFDDPCNNGVGAAGVAYVQDGQVTGVRMTSGGYGYLNATSYNDGFTDPCSTPLIDSSGSELIGYVTGVNVVRPGVGYSASDLINDDACPNDLEIYPVVDDMGRILDVIIINPGTIRVTPNLVINSEDGEGAIIQPILAFKPVQETPTKLLAVKKVVLCSEDHGL